MQFRNYRLGSAYSEGQGDWVRSEYWDSWHNYAACKADHEP